MSTLLQIALLVAALAFIALTGSLIPLVFETRRKLDRLAVLAEQSRNDLELFVRDGREAIRSVNEFTQQANEQMKDVAQVVHTIRGWSERADRLAGEVADTIEPPVLSLTRNLNLWGVGATTFLQAFFQPRSDNQPTTEDKDHG
jgi:uncharacterized protein YoxC